MKKNTKTLLKKRAQISEFIKKRRLELSMSRAELAKKTGLGHATIVRIEQEKYWPNLKIYIVILDALGVKNIPGIEE